MHPWLLASLHGMVVTIYALSMLAFVGGFVWLGWRYIEHVRGARRERWVETVECWSERLISRDGVVLSLVLLTLLLVLWERGERGCLTTRMEQWDARVGREFFPFQARYHEAVHRLRGRIESAEALMLSDMMAQQHRQEEAQRQFEERVMARVHPPEYAERTGWSRRRR